MFQTLLLMVFCGFELLYSFSQKELIQISPTNISFDNYVGDNLTFQCTGELKYTDNETVNFVMNIIDEDTGEVMDEIMCSDGNQEGYRGTVSKTKTNQTCQKWSTQIPHAHNITIDSERGIGDHNYCRNPTNKSIAWCYTTSQQTEWDYCYIPTCFCWTGKQTSYRGSINTTELGNSCVLWNSNVIYDTVKYTELQGNNYCRNPAGSKERVWCYTTMDYGNWEYCNVPICTSDGTATKTSASVPSAYFNSTNLTLSLNLVNITKNLQFICNYKQNHIEMSEALNVIVSDKADFQPAAESYGNSTGCIVRRRYLTKYNTSLYLCPNSTEVYTKKVENDTCNFSKKCTNDSLKLQTCGCNNINVLVGDIGNITIDSLVCENYNGTYEAVWSKLLCDKKSHCKNHDDESTAICTGWTTILGNTGEYVRIPEWKTFQCYDGTKINNTKRCDLKPDCTNTVVYDHNNKTY